MMMSALYLDSSNIVCPDSVAEWSKAIDLKSIILWMRRFKSCHCRFFKKVLESCVVVWEYGYGGRIGIVEYKTTWPSG